MTRVIVEIVGREVCAITADGPVQLRVLRYDTITADVTVEPTPEVELDAERVALLFTNPYSEQQGD